VRRRPPMISVEARGWTHARVLWVIRSVNRVSIESQALKNKMPGDLSARIVDVYVLARSAKGCSGAISGAQ
jgi:hypothetical protein